MAPQISKTECWKNGRHYRANTFVHDLYISNNYKWLIISNQKNKYVNKLTKYIKINPSNRQLRTCRLTKRDAATLLPIIQKVVRPGSIVYSDEWRAYRQIQPKLGLQHETVNHSVNFVDPSTGVHTQSIESYWAQTKYKFKVMKGVISDALPSYVDERMWRDRWGATTKDAFYNLCRHISEQF
jgi:transposase-like protein